MSSALPYFIAVERGYFKEAGIAPELVPLNSGPLIVQAMVSDQIEVASNLVTLEAANIDGKRPGTAVYASLNGQNDQYKMGQFVVRKGYAAKTLTALKGGKILAAPGPANVSAAKAVLKSVGLQEGKDYTIQEQQMGVHVGALKAGTFDAGDTLEPAATIAVEQGAADPLEAGVTATHLLGRKDAMANAAGGAFTAKFIRERPDVAARFAEARARAVKDANEDPSARAPFVAHMQTPASIASTVPLVKLIMVKDMSPAESADFQKFVDIGVESAVVSGKIDVKTMIKAY